MKALAQLSVLFFLLLLLPAAFADPPPEEDEGVVTFTDDELVIHDTDTYEQYVQAAQIADRTIMAYIVRSTESIQQGHRRGFQYFRDWYRARDARIRSEQATARLMQSIVGTAIGAAINSAIPGSGAFVNALNTYVNNACSEAVRRIGTIPNGDVNLFLDRHETTLEGMITELLNFPDEFRREHPEILEAARMEFIQESRSPAEGSSPSTEIGPGTRRILRGARVPDPGSAIANRFAVAILTSQIRAVIQGDQHSRMSADSYQLDVIAETTALRHLYSGEPERYCPVELSLSVRMPTDECMSWQTQQRRSGR